MRMDPLSRDVAVELVFDAGQCPRCRYLAARNIQAGKWQWISQGAKAKAKELLDDWGPKHPRQHSEPVIGVKPYHHNVRGG